MCPVCLATAAILAGSATGTGGLSALVALTIRKKFRPNPFIDTPTKEVPDVHDPAGSSSPQDRLPR